MQFETPQDVEDAYYDALEGGDVEAMARIWESSQDVVCLLPMTPMARGPQVQRLWQAIFEQGGKFDLQVRHLAWIEGDEVAIHLVEERSPNQGPGQAPPPIYATNVFRRGPEGWRLLMHQNSPTPPPPPSVPDKGQTALA
ncbi:nuclear transport factor 2 family protein [Thiorhodococcus mannitoliphagus]|uniref:Nuclear transport factor 2 family protein n=1 Tax=Thiorhodococcus mannitoliphagus TaxID=329406 RepID=A0A6P1E1Z6_9GAMM|nr:nuclear transport factor 2 family protein [Thiorhodococcus mannitoliphagus]NEX21725.1 nuclear transport factor 2 family protein [Thiorhodococcus mannitoliphagus]